MIGDPIRKARCSAGQRFFASAFFAVLVWHSAALASPARRSLLLRPGGPFDPGITVAATWAPLPPGTEEFELLLRCDLPTPITLRLTECERPELCSLEWIVPNLPCRGATLLLRLGLGGRELTWAQSETFRICADARLPVASAFFSRGELWLGCGAPQAHWGEAGGRLRSARLPRYAAMRSARSAASAFLRCWGSDPEWSRTAPAGECRDPLRLGRTAAPQGFPLRI